MIFRPYLTDSQGMRVNSKDKRDSRNIERYGIAPDIALPEEAKLFLESSPLAVFILKDDTVFAINARAAKMLKMKHEDIIGKKIMELAAQEDDDAPPSLSRAPETPGAPGEKRIFRFINSNNDVVWAEISRAKLKIAGEDAVALFAYDITESKEEEIQRREFMELARRQEDQLIHSTRLAELGEMAAAIAHELKQPLTGIRNFARNAYYMIEKEVGGPDEIKSNLRLISEQVDRAARIINQMRDLTRKSEPHFVTMDINATVKDSLDFLAPQLALSEVEVSLDLTRGMPYIKGDRLRLEQVFLNIITNARQAMKDSDEKRLDIRTYFEKENDCPITVEFRDSGVGFGEDVAKKLFTAFYSTKKPGQGTGLGLSISIRIIREHNGRIEAEGEPGKGARFIVRLPLPDGVKKDAGE